MSSTAGTQATVPETDVAIIGMACKFPGAANLSTFWDNIREGVEGVAFLEDDELETSVLDTNDRTSPTFVKAAAVIEDADCFDAAFFGYSPSEAELMDPQQRLFLQCAWHAIEDSGYDPLNCEPNTGVFAGARTNTYLFNIFSNARARLNHDPFEVGLGNDLSFLSSRVSYKLNLRGPSLSLQTACSTSLAAIHLACSALLSGDCDMALAGAATVNVPQKAGYFSRPGGILSADGHCRPFDDEATGTIFGSGVGVVVLKRLSDALRDRDHIYAVVKGTATNNDGAAKASFTAPSVQGQLDVIERALAVAGIDPGTITLLEAHGTGTRLGDPIEIRALTNAYRRYTDANNYCALGSVKGNLGHLDSAAGIAGLIKAVLALHHGLIPPSVNFRVPNQQINFAATPFYVNTELRDWPASNNPRRAGVSAFGIGGANAHVILEEAPRVATLKDSTEWHLIPLSARSNAALERQCSDLEQWLTRHEDASLADLAYTLHAGRGTYSYCRVLISRNVQELKDQLTGSNPEGVWNSHQERSERPIVFLFPGQGAQCLGVGRELYQTVLPFREAIDQCATIIQTAAGWDLIELLYPREERKSDSERRLQDTEFAQPALFAIEISLAKLWIHWGVRPAAMLGHSLGEYVAASLAGVLTLEEALQLVITRGKLMQEAPPGVMLAVHLDETSIQRFLVEADVDLAAVNGPSSCVLSGAPGSMQLAEELLKQAKIPFVKLNTSRAFHSRSLASILDDLKLALENRSFKQPAIPFVSNLTGDWITTDEATSPDYWSAHARNPVRFADGLNTIESLDNPLLIEVGPGNTLQKLAVAYFRGQQREDVFTSLATPSRSEYYTMLSTYARLWIRGAKLAVPQFYGAQAVQKLSLPGYPFEKLRYWISPDIERPVHNAKRQGKEDIDGWLHIPTWQISPSPSRRPSRLTRWIVLADDLGIARQLIAGLRAGGDEVIEVSVGNVYARHERDSYTLPLDDRAAYEELLRDIGQSELPLDIVHLWTLTDPKTPEPDGEEIKLRGYYSLLRLIGALEKGGTKATQITVVSNLLFQVGWNDAICPYKSLLKGPSIVAPQEYPELRVRLIDIDLDSVALSGHQSLCDSLLREIGNVTDHQDVALRGIGRWVRSFTQVSFGKVAPLLYLKERGVYLITGGFGSVGMIIAEYLARTCKATLVITTRTPLPDREDWDSYLASSDRNASTIERISAVRRLEQAGASVIPAAIDISDETGMRDLLDRIQSDYGPVHGVVHAAGITSGDSLYRSVSQIDVVESEAQFLPKVAGTRVLQRVLSDRNVDFCMLLSSNAATLGGLGYTAYAAANAFMDAASAEMARYGKKWISASWDPWPRETKKYQNYKTSMDQYAMTVSESEDAFSRVVGKGLFGHLVIVTGDMEARLNSNSLDVGSLASTPYPRPELSTLFVPPSNPIEEKLAAIWSDLLGVETIGVHDNFFELGGHSLLALHVVSRIREEFEVEVQMTQLFEEPTIFALSEFLVTRPDGEDDPARREILEFLKTLTDDEAELELQKRAGTRFEADTADSV